MGYEVDFLRINLSFSKCSRTRRDFTKQRGGVGFDSISKGKDSKVT